MIGECEFAVHGVHMPELRVVLYDLAPHPVQVPPSRPVHPRSHVQSIRSSLAAGESEFYGHAWHGSVLAPIFNTQGPALGPAEPALQMQSIASSLACGALEFSGHCWHVVLLVAPTVVEYWPSKHTAQLAFPDRILYFPALHAMHGPPFAPVNPALQMQLSKT